ncbi:MAG: transporter related [Actinomycetia bacterium]|nr:transporter related [Actinomycetes bacterium]
MSSELALRAEGIGKSYQLGATVGGFRYGSLRESLTAGLKGGLRRSREDRTFWALRDVSFSIGQGERVGVIGRNGAGKSTLLKILTRVTRPTEGRAEVHGRVGSLLEVGTGFHPELSGRDNILLAGAVLGMPRNEIYEKMDEIVAFAGVAQFLDTPVKRYSSGMYLRLAFAVAAHLEPDVLLVDEVLAVGDADFQAKCLGRMEEISAGGGRTVMFVSHSMPAVLRLCERVILMDKGQIIADGGAAEVVRAYLDAGLGSSAEREWDDWRTAPGDDLVRLRSVRVLDADGRVTEEHDIRRPIRIEVEYWALPGIETELPFVNLHLRTEQDVVILVTADFVDDDWLHRPRQPGLVRATCEIPGNLLAEGQVFVLAAVSSDNPVRVHAMERDAVAFQVIDRSDGDGTRGPYANEWPGVVRPKLPWTATQVEVGGPGGSSR